MERRARMMLPRSNSRRCFLTLVCMAVLVFAAVNVISHQADDPAKPKRGRIFESIIVGPFEAWTKMTTLAEGREGEPTPPPTGGTWPLPWYMRQGQRLPEPASQGPSGRRMAQLWPGEGRGNDHIENQLMFLPPDPAPAGRLKETTTLAEGREGEPMPPPTGGTWPLPWYMRQGQRLPEPAPRGPSGRRVAQLWPEEDRVNDRIENQLMFLPPDPAPAGRLKKILVFNGLKSWGLKPGPEAFAECPVSSCTLSTNRVEAKDADAILFEDKVIHPGVQRPPKQVWIVYFLESPYHTLHVKYKDLVNWTATYRRDSDIVAPYGKWVYWDPRVTQYPGPLRDFAANKTDKVAWFVSNCDARNERLQYAQQLQKYIQVDIYGACGNHKCPRTIAEKCFELLDRKYKFYLAFENSNCKEYITEKLFVNALGRNILPIVMGARPEDYAKAAPKNSYIHVDDFAGPKQLAEFLHKLDKDDDLYNSYFRWKGTGEFIKTHFFCRVCALLHDDFPIKSYRDVNEWWGGDETCTSGSWRTMEAFRYRQHTPYTGHKERNEGP